MSNWQALSGVALLGTRRAAPPVPQAVPGLEALLRELAGLAGRDPAAQVLATAGALDLYEQIGRAPGRSAPPAHVRPDAEPGPACPPAAGQVLATLLEAPQRKLLPEFLAALGAAGGRVPPALLPNILAAGAKTAALRPLILPVLGAEGRWLAARNPEWAYAAASIESWAGMRRAWAGAPVAARLALVQQLRATDPTRGRALLETIWRGENDHTRLRLIKLLEEGLSLEDEPLLETALDDRHNQVRRQAADLLGALPGSRLSQRLTTYVPAYLAWTPEHEQQISVRLPGVSPAMRRDGIVGVTSKDPARVRAQEIIQLVGGVPLDYWTREWAEAGTIARAIETTRWPRTLTTGFCTAVARQGDTTWAAVLLEAFGLTPVTTRLVPVVDEATLRRLTVQALHEPYGEGPLDKRGPLVNLLRRRPGPWPPDLARAITAVFAAYFAADGAARSPNPLLRSTLLSAALTFPPDLADEVAGELAGTLAGESAWRATAAEFVHTLRLRRRMLATLEQPNDLERQERK